MKKINICIGLLLVLAVCSCNNSDKKNNVEKNSSSVELEDLLFKYDSLSVNSCSELFAIGDEMIDVYINTINRAYEGNERAKSDLLDFDLFMNKFDIEIEKFSEICAEDFAEWSRKTDRRVAEVNDKLTELLNSDFYYEYIEIDDSILLDLDRQIKELNDDLEKMITDDSLKNAIADETGSGSDE